jgi:protease-4
LADTLEKAGLEADVIAITPYKSAGDALARSEMSEAVREMGNWMLDSLHAQMIEALSAGRGMSAEAAQQAINGTPCTDLEAQELGLVDVITNAEGLPDLLHGGNEGDAPTLGMWERAERALPRLPLPKPGKYVAVIPVEGFIADGSSQSPPVRPPVPLLPATAGDKTVVQAARTAERDPRTAAVVVWVNSRGGSATASEAMAAALEQLNTQKPVVAAFGRVAASGGYYAATPARWMVAEANSIVGSIGVIASKVAYADLLEKLEIGWETLKRGEHADLFTSPTTLSPDDRARLRSYIERVYDIFLERVAESRDMTREELEPLAGGRVWTGAQAAENGLIDEVGGLDAAIRKARQLADLPDDAPAYQVQPHPRRRLLPTPPEDEAAAYLLHALHLLQAFNRAQALALYPVLWAGRDEWY